MMCQIKICGIQRLEEVNILNKYLPEYAGFVFASGRRKVEADQAKYLCKKMQGNIKKVGVFVNSTQDEVSRIVDQCKLDVLQLHGDESNDYILKLKQKLAHVEIWKAIRVIENKSIVKIDNHEADVYLFDSHSNIAYGGTGITFDWELISNLSKQYKIVLAGGLNSYNVLKAKEIVKPYCLDVSSGVESNGYKDEEKIKEFIYTVRGKHY